jgi:hypothetical protein
VSCSNKNHAALISKQRKGVKQPDRCGEKHHYYGKKRSEEVKMKISLSRKGKATGESNTNWKGGISSANNKDRVGFSRDVRVYVLERDNFTCQICNQHGGYLQIDHIKSWSDFPELRFNTDNCRTVCMACHYYITFKRKMPKGIIWGHNFSRRIAS